MRGGARNTETPNNRMKLTAPAQATERGSLTGVSRTLLWMPEGRRIRPWGFLR